MLAQKENQNKSATNLPLGKQNIADNSNFPQLKRIKKTSRQDLTRTFKNQKTISPCKLTQKQIESQYITTHYGNQIKRTMFDLPTRHSSLINHNISAAMRAKMVDWMIEVLSSYKFSQECFCLAVRLMDQYFSKVKVCKQTTQLHLIGVACMFIACKYEQIYPLKMSIIYDKIGHKKLQKQSILKLEDQILQTLDFNLLFVTHFDLANLAIRQLKLSCTLSQKTFNYLKKVVTYLAKMLTYQLQIYEKYKMNELASAVIYVSFKIIEQVENSFKPEKYVYIFYQIWYISESLNIGENMVIQCSSKVLALAKSFQKKYSGLENLKKFNGFSLQSQKKK